MKFEFVEFYPVSKRLGGMPKDTIGTVHLYVIDCQLDVRGIYVTKRGKSLFFSFPHFRTIDPETNEMVMYPHLRWQDEKIQKAMINFLHTDVKPIIRSRLNTKSE